MTKRVSLTREEKRERLFLILYLLLFAAVALSLAYVQPWQNLAPDFENPPDEHARIRIPLFIARYGHLPVGTEPEMSGLYDGLYAMRPSLGLYPMALVMRLLLSFNAEGFALFFAARLVNVAFGLCTAYVVYLLSKRLFARTEIRWLFSCMTMFLPQHLFLHTYVNNESLNLLSVAMMLYGITVLYQETFTVRVCVLLAASWIICMLTCFNAYGFVLCTGILFLLRFFERREGKFSFDQKKFLRYGLPVIFAVLIGAGWWFVRMYLLWGGDIFALEATKAYHERIGAVQIGNIAGSFGSAMEILVARGVFTALGRSFIAMYGSMKIPAQDGYYQLYALFLGAGFVLGCAALAAKAKRLQAKQILLRVFVFAACVITFVLWLRYVLYTDFQVQARYIMPAVIPFFVFLSRGWELITEKAGEKKKLSLLPYTGMLFSVLMLLYYVYRVAFRYYLDF
ncbi:MAG: hypothetical protein IK016_02410 [Lachnospiraceae bacterium]|nr:hypothetical protein [Lachnospiraceae bacterium]